MARNDQEIIKLLPECDFPHQYHLFLMCCCENDKCVRSLEMEIERRFGVRCATRSRESEPGSDIVEEINRIADCSMMGVMWLSEDFLKSRFGCYELSNGIHKSVQLGFNWIIPVWTEKSDISITTSNISDTLQRLKPFMINAADPGVDVAAQIARALCLSVNTSGSYLIPYPIFQHQFQCHQHCIADNPYYRACDQQLRTKGPVVPAELKSLDSAMIDLYMEAISEGKEKQNTIRVMVVGHYNVGKTSLTRNMLKIPLKGIESTNGIDVHRCEVTVDGKWKRKQVNNHEKYAIARLANIARGPALKTRETETKQTAIARLANIARGSALITTRETETKQTDTVHENVGQNLDTDVEIIYERIQTHSQNTPENENTTVKTKKKIQNEAHKKSSYTKDPGTALAKETLKMFTKQISKRKSTNLAKSMNIWDFGGQFIFYATHQIFHTQRAVYVLVLDTSVDLEAKVYDDDFPERSKERNMKSICRFWMHSIHSFVGNLDGEPPVILVGTHKDKIVGSTSLKKAKANAFFQNIRQLFEGTPVGTHIQAKDFLIDNLKSTDKSVDELRKYIVDVAKQQKSWEREMPAKWIPLENSLMTNKQEKHVTFEEICTIDAENEFPIENRDQIRLFLIYHHQCGSIVYFNEPGLSEFVVLDPQWIIDAFKCIITSRRFCKLTPNMGRLWDKLVTKAILEPELIAAVWGNDKANDFIRYMEILLEYVERLGIVSKARSFNFETCELQKLGFYIVPSLLSVQSSEGDVDAFLRSTTMTTTSLVFVFKNGFVSPTLYHRTTSAAIGTWPIVKHAGKHLMFENIGVYEMDLKHAGIIEVTATTIEIRVAKLCHETVDCMQSERLRRFVEMVLKHEFERFRDDIENQYTLCIRCNARNNVSENLTEIERLKHQESAACSDCTDGHMMDIRKDVLNQWFPESIQEWIERNVSLDKRTQKVTGKMLHKIAHAIGFHWESLGPELDVRQTTIEQIIMDNPYRTESQIYHMFNKWVIAKTENATLDALLQALVNSPTVSIDWDEIKNIFDEFHIN